MYRIKALIEGRVQGVGFRYFTQYQATFLNLSGFVKNLSDGKVYLEAQGEKIRIYELLDKLREGNGFAKITSISIDEIKPINSEKKFKVVY